MVTGCNSNTRGFSNCVSDLLESVNKANLTPYEAISGEDMLAKIENYNHEAEKIMNEGKEKLYKKMMCKKRDGIKILACCDKLWKKKSRDSREMMEEEDPEEIPSGKEDLREEEEDCGRMKHE